MTDRAADNDIQISRPATIASGGAAVTVYKNSNGRQVIEVVSGELIINAADCGITIEVLVEPGQYATEN